MQIPKYLLNKKAPRIPFTQAGYDKIVNEKSKLDAERPDAVEHLKKAREMGDLSENGYYKATRQRLSFIDARLRRLTNIIKRATIITPVHTGMIDIGSTVTLKTEDREMTYTIVGGYESDPTKHSISHQSPLGRALIGKKVGDTVIVHAPVRTITYTILSLS